MKTGQSVSDLVAAGGTKKKPGLASQSWLRFDAAGTCEPFEADKQTIMHRAGIHARDLRILDPLLAYPSTLLGREQAIVVNLEHIKAIVTAEEVLLRNTAEEALVPVIEELKRRLSVEHTLSSDYDSDHQKPGRSPDQQKDMPGDDADLLPFEFRALEVALEAACSSLDARTTELEAEAYPLLDDLTAKVSTHNLERVRRLKGRMTRLLTRVQKVRDELEQLLDDDDDMAEMFLSRKLDVPFSEPPSPSSPSVAHALGAPTLASRTATMRTHTLRTASVGGEDVEELEMLLEVYFSQVDVTLNKLNTLREYIDDTEDYVNIQLDHVRNQLIRLEMMVSLGTAIMAIASAVGATFGVNLPFSYNASAKAYRWVIIITTVACLAIFFVVTAWLRYKRLIGV